MSNYSPWETLAEHPEIRVEFAEMEGDLVGWYDKQRSTIVLDKHGSRRQLRSTLAHELEHAARGDECPAELSPVLQARQEIAACVRAARRLVPLGRLVDALLWSQDEHELADELNVDEDTLRIRLLTLTPDEHALIDERLWAAEGRIA